MQAVKELVAEVEADNRAAQRTAQFLPIAEESPSLVMRRRLSELKTDALQAWSDSF